MRKRKDVFACGFEFELPLSKLRAPTVSRSTVFLSKGVLLLLLLLKLNSKNSKTRWKRFLSFVHFQSWEEKKQKVFSKKLTLSLMVRMWMMMKKKKMEKN